MSGREGLRHLPLKHLVQAEDHLRPIIYGLRTMGWSQKGKWIVNTGRGVTCNVSHQHNIFAHPLHSPGTLGALGSIRRFNNPGARHPGQWDAAAGETEARTTGIIPESSKK